LIKQVHGKDYGPLIMHFYMLKPYFKDTIFCPQIFSFNANSYASEVLLYAFKQFYRIQPLNLRGTNAYTYKIVWKGLKDRFHKFTVDNQSISSRNTRNIQ